MSRLGGWSNYSSTVRGLAKYTEGLGADLIIGTVLVTLGAVAGGLYYLGHF